MFNYSFIKLINYFQLSMAFLVILILVSTLFSIYLWSKNDATKYDKKSKLLNISLVLPTWNEELVIKSKLDGIIKQNYPSDLLEIIIIDAGSSDRTLEIVQSWQNSLDIDKKPSVRIIKENERLGKSVSINRAFSEARLESDILMMSDVDCRLSKDTLLNIGRIFNDKTIGAVTARQVLINPDVSSSSEIESNYRDFYSKMRVAESLLDSTPIFHGECSAYRREAIKDHRLIENANADDSQMAVAARISGFRSIYEPSLTFFEAAPPDSKSSNIQKIRRAQGLSRHFWRNKNHIFNKKMGNFRKILALEFSLHIFLPWAVFMGFLFGFIHIGNVAYNKVYSFELYYELPFIEQLLLFSDFMVILLLSLGRFGLRVPLAQTSFTFFQYMLVLFKSHLHILMGNSLHLWQQVPLVRESLNDFDNKNIEHDS